MPWRYDGKYVPLVRFLADNQCLLVEIVSDFFLHCIEFHGLIGRIDLLCLDNACSDVTNRSNHSVRSGSRQAEEENCTFARGSLRPNAATMTFDDAAHRGEPHTRTLEFVGVMQTLKQLE